MTFETEPRQQDEASQPLYPQAQQELNGFSGKSFEMQMPAGLPSAPYYIVQPTANGDSLVYVPSPYYIPGNEVPAEALHYPVEAHHHGECYEESVYSPSFAADMAVRRASGFFIFCTLIQIFNAIWFTVLVQDPTLVTISVIFLISAILGWIGAATRSTALVTLHTFSSTFIAIFSLFTFWFMFNIFGSIIQMMTVFAGLSLVARIRYHRSLPADLE
eukprot:TRINITY_DN1094_c0_g1_i1.p1 TRINITY_DN1094_c0_g1~~TRINITY_DN1094_c0_g1_i1.p1  ORF type:complete len:233 (-),score=127.88 TRINITY_DN1094_c0_g1_i1:244-894(-)